MKIVVVGGAGAMGGVWASRLHGAGHHVSVLDVSPAALGAIAADGLIVTRKDGTTTAVQLQASDDPTTLGQPDTVIFFTKSYHTADAAKLAQPLVGPETTVVSLQNGWGNAGILAKVFPAERLVMGVTYQSANVTAPGQISHTADGGPTFVGPYQDGASLERAEYVARAMEDAGIATTVSPHAKTEVWKKLILNCATLPTSALTGLYSGELGKPGPLLDTLDEVTQEASAVARALGHEIEAEERISFIHDLLSRAGRGRSSMLQDVGAQRRTEIDVVNGAVVREGDRLGVEVSINRALVALIKGLERSWRQDEAAVEPNG